MGKLIEFRQGEGKQEVIYKQNGKFLGEILQDVDGDFYYWPEPGGGAWSGVPMMEIGVHLIILNKIHNDDPGEEDGPWAEGWEERNGRL
jgi:hypothetical protein